MTELIIKLPDGKEARVAGGRTGLEVLDSLQSKPRKKGVAFKDGDRVYHLAEELPVAGELELLTTASSECLEILRHSAAHILAAAVKRLYPEVRFWKGPAINDTRYGFYYDMDMGDAELSPEDLPAIRKEMLKISKENQPFTCSTMTRAEALDRCRQEGDIYKESLIAQIPEGEPITFYTNGDFSDLCRGPHLRSTSQLGDGFDLIDISGAYFQNDPEKPMLTRIYGHAFPGKKELQEHLDKLKEMAKRDHRKVGKELELYSVQPDAGAGLVFWHPKGGRLRHLIENFWREEHIKRGYEIVYTPHLMKQTLWEQSGHYEFYGEMMYEPNQVEGVNYLTRPMNCPGHILIYKDRRRSYRELPMRLAELGTVYRFEKSGVLHGMLRVRGFTQDDAHIFCTEDQLEQEIGGCLELMDFLMQSFGYKYKTFLATRPEKFIGDAKVWEKVEKVLASCLDKLGIPYQLDPGEGAFYAPKVDVKLLDALGREWQGPTVQVDFNLPERFDLKYQGSDGHEHRLFMIHRALLGSMERFVGGLIEHYAGAFPVWLSPVQVRVLTITSAANDYAEKCRKQLFDSGFRADCDISGDKVGKQIRRTLFEEKIPFAAVVGETEAREGTLTLRHRTDGDLGTFTMEELIKLIGEWEKSKK